MIVHTIMTNATTPTTRAHRPGSARTSLRITRLLPALTIGALALGLVACGSDSDGETAAQPPEVSPTDAGDADLDLAAVRAELDAIEFESESVDSGGVLGNQPLDAADAVAGVAAEAPVVEGEELSGDCQDGAPCDDVTPEVIEPDPRPRFQPAPEWASFCTVLAEIEERPFPTNDLEGLRVIDIWFGLLEPHVPGRIGPDFAVLDRAVDQAVAAQDFSIIETAPGGVDEAGERIGDAVDQECSGVGPAVATPD